MVDVASSQNGKKRKKKEKKRKEEKKKGYANVCVLGMGVGSDAYLKERAALVASCFRGALPFAPFRAVCLDRAMVISLINVRSFTAVLFCYNRR